MEAASGNCGIPGIKDGGVAMGGDVDILRGSDSRECRLGGVFWILCILVAGGGERLTDLHGGEEEHVVGRCDELGEIGGW